MSSDEAAAGKGQLGLWDAISIIVGIVIGTTIYKVPWLIFGSTSDPMWGLLVWVLGGIIAMIGAFCYAELATTYPRSGGDYYYQSRAFGPGTGFLFGWAQLTIVMPASIGAMASVFADFLKGAFFPGGLEFELPLGDHVYELDANFTIATEIVLLLTFTNILGVFVGKWVQNLLTLAKVVGLGAIILAGFLAYDPASWEYTVKASSESGAPVPLIGALALILVMYAYGGWNDAAFVAAEVRNPRRNIPRALFLGVAIIIAVYLLVNAAYISAVGWDNVTGFNPDPVPSRTIAAALAGTEWAEYGSRAMSVIVMISALGAVNGLIFTGARVYATLGADHRLFGWMGHWRPGKRAPIMALLLQAVLTVFIVGAITTRTGHEAIVDTLNWLNHNVIAEASKVVESVAENREIPAIEFKREWRAEAAFETLVDRTAPIFWFFFLLTGLALFVLREKNKHLERPYSVPLYPVVPILFCCSCAWMLYQATDYVKWHALFAVIILLLGVPLYWFSRLISGSRGAGPEDELVIQPYVETPARPPRQSWR